MVTIAKEIDSEGILVLDWTPALDKLAALIEDAKRAGIHSVEELNSALNQTVPWAASFIKEYLFGIKGLNRGVIHRIQPTGLLRLLLVGQYPEIFTSEKMLETMTPDEAEQVVALSHKYNSPESNP